MKENFNPGDYIKVSTNEEVFEGQLLKRPELLGDDVIVIKLDSGYNIGIEKKNIKEIKVIKPYKPKEQKSKIKSYNPKLPSVSVLSFGGTISSKVDYATGGVFADYTAEDFVEMCPELLEIANIKAKKVMSVMSEDLCPEDWKKMAEEIFKELQDDKIKGIVISQGTDTLHFSVAAMSFMLRELNKPVVFTAAQRSIDRGSTDAFMNLICAVTAAAKSDIGEIVTCMHGTSSDDYCILIRGTKVRKMHTARRDAFRPINDMPIAKLTYDGKIEITNNNYRKISGKPRLENTFNTNIAMIPVYPGIDPGLIDYLVEKYDGLVIAATALGHVPTNNPKYSILNALEKAKKLKKPVVIASQTLYGRTHKYVYTNLRKLSIEKHCIYVEDMTPETAYVKLGWIMGKTKNFEEIKKLMETNIANEFNPRIQTNEFLN